MDITNNRLKITEAKFKVVIDLLPPTNKAEYSYLKRMLNSIGHLNSKFSRTNKEHHYFRASVMLFRQLKDNNTPT